MTETLNIITPHTLMVRGLLSLETQYVAVRLHLWCVNTLQVLEH